MNREKIIFCGRTDMGRQRTNNEDAFVAEQLDNSTVLAVAIDGVGGYEGGEVAAEIAQKEIPAYLKEFNRGDRLELLKQAVVGANNAIFKRRQSDTERANMSCVLTAALVDMSRKVIDMVHVGDTRLYQYHHGELMKLSHDHSLIGYREEVGDLTEEQAMHHPQRNVISRDVGSARHEVGDPDFLEAEEFPLLPNSTFLLCSDGLTDLITSRQIVSILEQPVSLDEKTKMLIDAANKAGGKDNITAVLVEYQADNIPDSIKEEKKQSPVKETKEAPPVIAKSNKRNTTKWIYILLAIIVLLMGTCIALSIFTLAEHNHAKELEELLTLEKSISPNDSIPNNIINIIERYSNAYEKNDTAIISQLFAPKVRRYCNAHDLTNEQVVGKHLAYDKKFDVQGKHVTVRWNTLKTMQLPNEETLVVYIEDYSIDRVDTTKPSMFVIEKFIVLDKNSKIVSLDDVTRESK